MENIYKLKNNTDIFSKNLKQVYNYKTDNKIYKVQKNQIKLYNSKSLDKETLNSLLRQKQRNLFIEDVDLKSKIINAVKQNKNPLKLSIIKYNSPQKKNPFENIEKQGIFAYSYLSGQIPVKMSHGSVNLKIEWLEQPEDLNYDPILINCFEGLKEVAHPYSFLAYKCTEELLKSVNSKNKVMLLLPKLIKGLREALNSNYESICLKAIEITKLLSDIVKEKLNPYLKYIIQPINKLSYNLKYKDFVFEIFKQFEGFGGKVASDEIKKKVPSYMENRY